MIPGFLKDKRAFVLFGLSWIAAGILLPKIALPLVLISILVFKYRNHYEEIFLGLYLVLFFSDSYYQGFQFAHDSKPFYMFLMAGLYFLSRKDFPDFNKFIYSFAPFLILAALVIPKSEIVDICWQKTLSYALLLLLVPNYITKLYKEEGELFFRNFIALLATILLVSLFFWYFKLGHVGVKRFQGFLGNPNAMGLFCTTFFLLFMVVRQYFPDLFSRRETILIYVLIFVAVILSGSRNTWMSLIIFIFFRAFYRISPYIGFILFVGILFSYEFFTENIHPLIRYLGLGEYLREDTLDKGSGRLVAWAFGWDQIKLNMFFGKGFAHEEFIYYAYGNQQKLNLLGHDGASHNSYLATWLNSGLFGVILYFSAFFSKFIRSAKNTNIGMPVLFSILWSANFESWLVGSLNPYTILLLICLTIMTGDEFNKEDHHDPVPLL